MTRMAWLLCVSLGVAALCSPLLVRFPVRLVYNATPSVARGWYAVDAAQSAPSAQSPRVGSVVLVRLPAPAALLASHRGYLPAALPILKRVAAVAPQRVCVMAQELRIDGARVASVRERDGEGRALPVWHQCRRLAEGEIFLLGDAHLVSFDSRYFGAVDASLVLGEALPLWTWSTP